MEAEKKNPRTVICVGDVHGHIHRLRDLWRNLEAKVGSEVFNTSTVIFLGDFNDRGPNTKEVLEFLIALPHLYPEQRQVFLCGNHDFAFAAFVGALPPLPDGFEYSSTWPEFEDNEEREGWWSGPGQEEIHLQGRRWGGRIKIAFNVVKGVYYQGSIYDSQPTFESYGVAHGDRAGLIAALPESHKEFLRNLKWVYEEEGCPEMGYTKVIAVHAGLESKIPVDTQLQILRERNAKTSRIEQLAGRKNVWNTPPELVAEGVLLVSGHHAQLHLDKNRLIIDESGGLNLPIAAVILPGCVIVRDTDKFSPTMAIVPPQPALAAH